MLALLALTFNPVRAIIGGTSVSPKAYDYTIAIFQPALSEESSTPFICDGVLITPSAVVTIAECVQGLSSSDITIRSGTNSTGYQNVTVSSILTNPDYDSETLTNDIAIIHLGSNITNVLPATIPSSNSSISSHVGLLGWGSKVNATEAISPNIQQADVAIVDTVTCTSQLSSCYTLDSCQHFCTVSAGPGEGYGDAGGPVVDASGQLIGLISGNPTCAQSNSIALEVNIAHFHDWIVENAF